VKVVVTGGSGRIGKYVVAELIAHSHAVTVFDRVQPTNTEGVRWLRGDIENLGDVISALHGNDAVIHLAAYPNPTQEVLRHVLFRNNVMGTYNVHEAAFCVNIRRVVMMSSAAVLGWPYDDVAFAPKYLPIDEHHPTSPQDPYGLGKLCEEQVARAYALKSGMQTIALRPERVLLPDVSERIRRENGIQFTRYHLFGYVDVRDLATACRQALEMSGLQHEVMFVGADDSLSSEPLCDLIPRLVPGTETIAQCLTGTRGHISSDRAKQLLGWRPRFSWRVQS
jgi:nucleoside-diphosphate-sugar epimerase